MKKTLLAAALLAGFAGAASAQSSVTLYGVVDSGFAYQTISFANNVSQSSFGLRYGARAGNRWGLRGVEDIGNGNKVNFVLESGFSLGGGNNTQNALFGRAATLGISNNAWGDVRMGRMTNLSSDWQPSYNGFGAGYGQLSMGNTFGSAATVRMNNTLMYRSPRMNGFQVGLGYSFATGLTSNGATDNAVQSTYNFASTNNTRALTLGARYVNGPVSAAATYEQAYAAERSAQSGKSMSSWIIGGSYDLKVVKLSAAYGQTRDGFFVGSGAGGSGNTVGGSAMASNPGGGGNALVFADGFGIDSYTLGAVVPVNKVSKVILSWGMIRPAGQLNSRLNTSNQNTYGIGYEHSFTKRTVLYAYGGQTLNYATVDSAKSTVVGLGLTHSF